MADVTFEYALAVVRTLSLEDKGRLRQWLQVEESRHTRPPVKDTVPLNNWYTREMHWLSTHQAAYPGQWVALDGEHLLSHSPDVRQVYAEARAAGCTVPFVAYIDTPHAGQWGGWL